MARCKEEGPGGASTQRHKVTQEECQATGEGQVEERKGVERPKGTGGEGQRGQAEKARGQPEEAKRGKGREGEEEAWQETCFQGRQG